MRMPVPRPSGVVNWESSDLAIAALGYEARSSHLASRGLLSGRRRHALGFDSHHVLSYEANLELFKEAGFEITLAGDNEFRTVIEHVVAQTVGEHDEGPLLVEVDISSFSRSRLAHIFEVLQSVEGDFVVDVVFRYSLALFDPPPSEPIPNRHVGPVTPHFAGWTSDPEAGVTTILGLGYEPERAIGAVEQVQGGESWLFLPVSPIEEYEAEVKQTNHIILEAAGERHVMPYLVLDPFHTFVALESLANRSLRTGGGIIFPFGPKIFCLVALAVGGVHRDIAVWRVSPGDLQPPQERKASDLATQFRIAFQPDEKHAEEVTGDEVRATSNVD